MQFIFRETRAIIFLLIKFISGCGEGGHQSHESTFIALGQAWLPACPFL